MVSLWMKQIHFSATRLSYGCIDPFLSWVISTEWKHIQHELKKDVAVVRLNTPGSKVSLN